MDERYHSFLSERIIQYKEFFSITRNWNSQERTIMRAFDRHCQEMDDGSHVLTQEMVDSWCLQHPNENRESYGRRIYRINGFLNFMRSRKYSTVQTIKPPKLKFRKTDPYIFQGDELKKFFFECDHLAITKGTTSERIRKIIIPTIFRLMYSTGMRPLEARLLERSDVNLKSGVINIHATKGYIEHYVVMHETLRKILTLYDKQADLIIPGRKYFFQSASGTPYSQDWLHEVFLGTWRKANGHTEFHPTPYSFRHNYAIDLINSWLGVGNAHEIFDKIVILSKAMGHAEISSTLYYFHLCPQLAEIIDETGNEAFNDMIPEVFMHE